MKCYMDCNVYCTTVGRGRNARKRWVIVDAAWGNKLVASFSEAEFFSDDCDDTQIILDWMKKKQNDPEWLRYKFLQEQKRFAKDMETVLAAI